MEVSPDTVAQAGECLDHLAYSAASVGLDANVRLVESLWLTTFVGHAYYRRSEMTNADNELVTGGRQDIPRTVVTGAGLELRIPEQ